MTYEETVQHAEAAFAEAVDQAENNGGIENSLDIVIDNVFDTYDAYALAITMHVNRLARESGFMQ